MHPDRTASSGSLLAHVHLGSDFGGEVLFLLLDALALDEVDSVNKLDGAAQLLGSVGNVALDGALPAAAGSFPCRRR